MYKEVNNYNYVFHSENVMSFFIPWIFSPIVCNFNIYLGSLALLIIGALMYVYSKQTIYFFDDSILSVRFGKLFNRQKRYKYDEVDKVFLSIRTMSVRYPSTITIGLKNGKSLGAVIHKFELADIYLFLKKKGVTCMASDNKYLRDKLKDKNY